MPPGFRFRDCTIVQTHSTARLHSTGHQAPVCLDPGPRMITVDEGEVQRSRQLRLHCATEPSQDANARAETLAREMAIEDSEARVALSVRFRPRVDANEHSGRSERASNAYCGHPLETADLQRSLGPGSVPLQRCQLLETSLRSGACEIGPMKQVEDRRPASQKSLE